MVVSRLASWKNHYFGHAPEQLDERQITHLICARLKYDLYDFFRAVWACFLLFFLYKRPQNTPSKSHIDHILGGHRLDE